MAFGLNQNASARQWHDLEQSRDRQASLESVRLQTRLGEAVRKRRQAEARVQTLADAQAQVGDRSEEIEVLAARAGQLEPLLVSCLSVTASDASCVGTVQDTRAVLLALQGIDATP